MDTTLLLHLSVEGNFRESFDQIKESTQGIQKEVEKINERAEKSNSLFKRLGDAAISFDGIVRGAERLAGGLTDLISPGIALNTSLTDLQAITGVTGDGLKQIEGYARQTAKAFGIDAAGAVESYKLILGQLSPELAKSPVALKEMGEHVATLSKLMGGDAVATAETLNTAMNQYGVDLSDPIQAS